MPEYCQLLLLIPLLWMAVQDFRSRRVGVWWMALFAAGAVACPVWANGVRATALNTALNTLLLAYMAAGVVFYLRVTRRRWIDPLKGYIGGGDVWFVLAMAPLFELKAYLLLLIAGMSVSLCWWWATGRRRTIPLVGMLGGVLGIYLLYNVL